VRVLILDRTVQSSPQALGLADGLRANGVEVLVGGPAGFVQRGVVQVYPRPGGQGQRVKQLVELATGGYRLLRLLRGFRPDVVHFQWARPVDYALARVTRLAWRGPLVFTSHVPVERIPGDLAGDAKRQARILDMSSAVITLGPGLTEALRRAHPTLNGKVHTIRHGNYEHVIRRTDRAEARRALDLPATGSVFAFLGQVRPGKGVETLLDGFRAYRDRGGGGTLVVVGSATDPAYFERLRLAGSEAVRWMVSADPLPQEQLDLAASAANEIVLPFDAASQSGTAIFGMTHGRCVVTTSVGEVGNTVGDFGVVVQPRDPDAVAAAMERADLDPDGCDRIGERAREFALEELSWTSIGAEVREIYEDTLR
jgi:glycosyltransferase involved in cell wall biosynthesis